jgi:predicted Zn-dependent protease
MSYTPDRPLRLALFALAAALAGPGAAAPPPQAGELIAKAQAAIAASDGIAAEASLRRALEAGAEKPVVAAAMGEALLLQGAPDKAREWLGSGKFAPGQESYGWRILGRLECAEGNLAAAGKAYDRALQATPNDSLLWVDIGRLRYAGGEQVQAIQAADKALAGDAANPRALEFRGQLIRDQYGLVPALAWFEAGLARSPDDLALLGEYAATLGELGRAREMLVVTRHMLDRDPANARALYLHAVLAARAGKMELARAILGRTGDRLAEVPAAMLLRGILELEAGNANLAIDVLDRLLRLQPANERARLLLARAAFVAGDRVQLTAVVQAAPRPSPYLLRLLARARELEGRRDLAAPLLRRAGAEVPRGFAQLGDREDIRVLAADWTEKPGMIGPGIRYVRKLVEVGNLGLAETVAERLRSANPGSADVQGVAGDVQLLKRNPAAALDRYRAAGTVRVTPDLLARAADALDQLGRSAQADDLVETGLAGTPSNLELIALAAGRAQRRGDGARARELSSYRSAVLPAH